MKVWRLISGGMTLGAVLIAGTASFATDTGSGRSSGKDGDGSLVHVAASGAQESRGKEHKGKAFKHADRDKNGKISLKERKAIAKKRFKRRDLNSDGAITKEEARKVRKKNFKKRRAKRKQD